LSFLAFQWYIENVCLMCFRGVTEILVLGHACVVTNVSQVAS